MTLNQLLVTAGLLLCGAANCLLEGIPLVFFRLRRPLWVETTAACQDVQAAAALCFQLSRDVSESPGCTTGGVITGRGRRANKAVRWLFKSLYCVFFVQRISQKYFETDADTTDAIKHRISHDQNSATERERNREGKEIVNALRTPHTFLFYR